MTEASESTSARGATDRPRAPLLVAHSSDLHIGAHRDGAELASLRQVLETAARAGARALVLAGDIFDSNRVALAVIERAQYIMHDARMPVVILPGNHDPATDDSVYRRGALGDVPDVHIFGVTCEESVVLPGLGLELCGKPHRTYADMRPLPEHDGRAATWRIAVGHGHWVRGDHDRHRSWLFFDEDLAATGADYVALGHWDLAQPAGDGSVPAYYSGSPRHAGTINIVRFSDGAVDVRRERIEP